MLDLDESSGYFREGCPKNIRRGLNRRTEVIERRFKAGLRNFESLYQPLVNEWQSIDNGGSIPRLLSEGGRA